MDIWQLISVNINRQRSLDAPTIKENCWCLLEHTRTLLPFSPFKKPSPGMCRTWNCLDMCVMVQAGFATLLVPDQFCTIRRSWKFEERSSDKKEENSQLDYIIRRMRRNDEVYIHNERRLWANWDHYLIVARKREEAHTKIFHRRNLKSGRDGSR